jgi:phosphatidylserine/phosphatidylglycerophosphate/cardiolipin synthase-like enzyme
MAVATLAELDQYKANVDKPFPPGYPDNVRAFYSPVDNIHGALVDLLEAATTSIIVAMYGYDDEELNQIIRNKLESGRVFISMSFDSTQAGGVNESDILKKWQNETDGNSIAIGRSSKGAIMHMKVVIVDGVDVITGSTNWSAGGQAKQDNQLIVVRDPLVAAEARARIDMIHDDMLKQMAAKAIAEARDEGKKARPSPGQNPATTAHADKQEAVIDPRTRRRVERGT